MKNILLIILILSASLNSLAYNTTSVLFKPSQLPAVIVPKGQYLLDILKNDPTTIDITFISVNLSKLLEDVFSFEIKGKTYNANGIKRVIWGEHNFSLFEKIDSHNGYINRFRR